jgi:hypothetical protein
MPSLPSLISSLTSLVLLFLPSDEDPLIDTALVGLLSLIDLFAKLNLNISFSR